MIQSKTFFVGIASKYLIYRVFYSYRPRSRRDVVEVTGGYINFSRELGEFEESIYDGTNMNDFMRAMQQDTNVAVESSITLDENPLVDSSVQPPPFQLDDFGGEASPPEEIERQLLEGLPAEVRRTITPFFHQNRNFVENVSQQLELQIPVQIPVQIPLVRREEQNQTNFSVENRENVIHPTPEGHKRTSKSPRQPLAQIDVNVMEGPVEPLVAQVPDQIQIPVADPVIDELPPQQQVEQVLVPEVLDVVNRPRLRRRARGSPEEHNLELHPPFVSRRRQPPPLIDTDLDETEPSVLQNASVLQQLTLGNQVETIHLIDGIDNFLTRHLDPMPPLDQRPPIILRPSDSQLNQPIPRRTSSLLEQVHDSPMPVMPTVQVILNEQRQHLDSAIINTQHVQNELLEIQRKNGVTPAHRTTPDENAFLPEVPSNDQIRQLEDASIIIRHANTPQQDYTPLSLASFQQTPDQTNIEPEHLKNTPVVTEPAQTLAGTYTEKVSLEMFFKLLALKTLTDLSEIPITAILKDEEYRAHKFVTLLSKFMFVSRLGSCIFILK